MVDSTSWRSSRLVRALIAVGLAVIGAVLVWAGLARPSTPGSAFTGAPNGHSLPSTSPASPSQPTPERAPGRADKTNLRDQITGLVLPESEPVSVSIPRIGVRSKLVPLGLKRGVMETPPPCRCWLVLAGALTGCTRAGSHRRARHLERPCGLLPPTNHAARRSSERYPKGRQNCRLHCHPGDPIFEVAVPDPRGVRSHRPCWTPTDHLWWHLRQSPKQVPGQRRCLRQAAGGAPGLMADSRRWSALDHQHKGFRRNEGVRVQHAKLVTTRPQARQRR